MLREAPPPKEGDEARLALDDTEGLEGMDGLLPPNAARLEAPGP